MRFAFLTIVIALFVSSAHHVVVAQSCDPLCGTVVFKDGHMIAFNYFWDRTTGDLPYTRDAEAMRRHLASKRSEDQLHMRLPQIRLAAVSRIDFLDMTADVSALLKRTFTSARKAKVTFRDGHILSDLMLYGFAEMRTQAWSASNPLTEQWSSTDETIAAIVFDPKVAPSPRRAEPGDKFRGEITWRGGFTSAFDYFYSRATGAMLEYLINTADLEAYQKAAQVGAAGNPQISKIRRVAVSDVLRIDFLEPTIDEATLFETPTVRKVALSLRAGKTLDSILLRVRLSEWRGPYDRGSLDSDELLSVRFGTR